MLIRAQGVVYQHDLRFIHNFYDNSSSVFCWYSNFQITYWPQRICSSIECWKNFVSYSLF